MKIEKTESWYRPYGIVVNGKNYFVNQIHFYKDNAILCSSQSGWLMKNDYVDIDEIELPVEEIKLKRKEKFDGTIFAMTYRDWNETRVNLYIPAEMFNIHFEKNVFEANAVYAIYKGENEIYIRKYVKNMADKLHTIRQEYNEAHKNVSDINLSVSKAEVVMENLDKLKALAVQYIEERNRLAKLVIEDIDLTEE